ncbi:MAG TPA: hypothetical protein VFL42_03405 [Terriglobales bacterium]|nr:hypothetical protein [Terriglobales bacterium]
MSDVEELKRVVREVDAKTLPTPLDWDKTEGGIGFKLPDSLKELLNNFGHGTWGMDLVVLNPKGAGVQGITLANLLRVKPWVDATFQGFMPGEHPRGWSLIPFGILPYRKHLFMNRSSEEVIIYDGDYCQELKTGAIGLPNFILRSVGWPERAEMPHIWRGFAEANWPAGAPIFTSECREGPDGFYAICP